MGIENSLAASDHFSASFIRIRRVDVRASNCTAAEEKKNCTLNESYDNFDGKITINVICG